MTTSLSGGKAELEEIQERLTGQGFTVSLGQGGFEATQAAVPRDVKDAFADLAKDPYAPESGRHRSYSRMLYLPWRDSLEWLPEVARDGVPSSPYDQGRFNGEFQQTRYFPGVGQRVGSSPFLEKVVRADLASLSGLEVFRLWPVYVGVHLIRLLVEPGRERAMTTPDCLHQDGGADMFGFVHLIGLSNAAGGDTLVAPPECAGMAPHTVAARDRLAHFRLERPLDWYAINDHRVSHHAAAIRATDPQRPAVRDVVLLGISPYKPIFH